MLTLSCSSLQASPSEVLPPSTLSWQLRRCSPVVTASRHLYSTNYTDSRSGAVYGSDGYSSCPPDWRTTKIEMDS